MLVKGISATGFAFVTEEDYKVGLRVTLLYDMGNGKWMKLERKAVRKQHMDNNGATLYGCRFSISFD